MSIVGMAHLAAVFAAGLVGTAAAVTYDTIAGRWCGKGITYTFTTGQLRVEFSNGTPTRYFRIVRYRYSNEMVVVDWINADGKEFHTDFAEFSSSGRYMAQLPNSVGPHRPLPLSFQNIAGKWRGLPKATSSAATC
jgi:hypothetical protein